MYDWIASAFFNHFFGPWDSVILSRNSSRAVMFLPLHTWRSWIRPLWSPHRWKSVPVSMPAAEMGLGCTEAECVPNWLGCQNLKKMWPGYPLVLKLWQLKIPYQLEVFMANQFYMESFPFSQVWLAEDIPIEPRIFSQNAGADAQPGRHAFVRASGKACVAENDLPLPLAFSGLRSPKGWDWGVGIVNIPKWLVTTFLGMKIQFLVMF